MPSKSGSTLKLAAVLATCGLIASYPQAAQAVPQAQAVHNAHQAPARDRQQDFAAAAAEFGVPQNVLMAVSYLQSRWDANGGRPSVTAGYGPMHLTDAKGALKGDVPHHADGTEDARGDTSRPLDPPKVTPDEATGPDLQTADLAATLTKTDKAALLKDPAQNIRGGAALLAHYQRQMKGPDGDWYAAVARYGRSTTEKAARAFASEVYKTIKEGASRTTDDGQRVTLKAADVSPDTGLVARLGLPKGGGETECPRGLGCEWIAAPYIQNSDNPRDYGNYDKADRPRSQDISHIVIHNMEGYYEGSLRLLQDPTRYVSWQYSLRAQDGHVAQHVKAKDVAWQAGNWFINSRSIGLEHEGFLRAPDTWYTEAQYRSSAKLVRYLARKHDIPLDRAHILGHDTVPGTIPTRIDGMHNDPGPYWNWAHYFDLLGAPFEGRRSRGDTVMINPDYGTNNVANTGCDGVDEFSTTPCPEHGSSSIMLRTEPRDDAPLVTDVANHRGQPSMNIYDHSARASTGQKYAVADRRADGWTAIWYLGQKAWFHSEDAVPARSRIITPKAGKETIPVYGRPHPEAEAWPDGIEPEPLAPLPYTFAAGQKYTAAYKVRSENYYAKVYDQSTHTVIRGDLRYYQIQFGHRAMFVNADDVDVVGRG